MDARSKNMFRERKSLSNFLIGKGAVFLINEAIRYNSNLHIRVLRVLKFEVLALGFTGSLIMV